MLGTDHLKSDETWIERASRVTVPGQATWADPDTTNQCGTCHYWITSAKQRGHRCALFMQRMGSRKAPILKVTQRACTEWREAVLARQEP